MSIIKTFNVGFWHPFGPHAGETADEIIKRKRNEIKENGWTLWSFQIRRTLAAWYQEILEARPQHVFVFCSDGKGATDPKSAVAHCSHYRLISGGSVLPIPSSVKIPHPIGSKAEASAFIVEDIIYPLDAPVLHPVQWYVPKENCWRSDNLPTRGEYLIKRGGTNNLRSYRAVLVLRAPYLAVVTTSRPL